LRLLLVLSLLSAGLYADETALEARVHVFQAACSQAPRHEAEQALAQASALLEQGCGIKLSVTAWTQLPLEGWCHLPADKRTRRLALKRLAASAKAAAPSELAFFLLPSSVDERLSWALVDVSLRSGCDSPQEARYLKNFGTAFFTDMAWASGEARRGQVPSPAALLVAHEVMHALSQRSHPTGAPRGEVLADHTADIGAKVPGELCECAKRSPYLTKPR
jgi:hypothetical protein